MFLSIICGVGPFNYGVIVYLMYGNLNCTGWIQTYLIILSICCLCNFIFYLYMYSRYGRHKEILQDDPRYKGKYAL